MSGFIYKEVQEIIRRTNTRDPFQIAREMGIHVIINDDFRKLKGMYKVINRSRFIFISGSLSAREQRIVCAHELGHDRFHRHFAKTRPMQDFMLYETSSENEANIFAAELLIDDEDVLQLTADGYDVFQVAAQLGYDISLVLVKIDEMRKRGHEMRVPYRPQAGFMGGAPMPQ
jgi:Zn-dependent peptidase ImmA (M78 family)